LPDLETIVDDGVNPIELHAREFQAQVLPTGFPATWVWGYLKKDPSTGVVDASRPSYIGPVIVATRGKPTTLKFVNDLGTGADTKIRAWTESTDQTLHWADPFTASGTLNGCNHMAMPPPFGPDSECSKNYRGAIPAVVHLHGGEVPPELDGGPDAWVTSDGTAKGLGFYSQDGAAATNYMTYRYPNSQEEAAIWFHDHTLGATRLNVYAGLAGAYLVTDPAVSPRNLPLLTPLVIQDRMFDTSGQLFFTAGLNGGLLWALNPDHPYWNPEFVGDVVVVNGKAWPYKTVEAKRQTLLLLNGSNARTYELFLADPTGVLAPPPMWAIATDGGYLDAPQPVKKIVVMPGERYQVIVDFGAVPPGSTFILRNTAKTPFPGGAASPASTVGEVMQFRVIAAAGTDNSFNPAVPGAVLRGGTTGAAPITRLADPVTGQVAAGVVVKKTRQLTLNEVMGPPQIFANPIDGLLTAYPGGPLEILVNNTKWHGKQATGVTGGMYDFATRTDFGSTANLVNGSYASELPTEGETEIWEIVNLTADAHPIHLHLVQFQILNRQKFDTKAYGAVYAAAFPGGGYDPMTMLPYPPGVFIPGFGPPLDYNTGNVRALGGNPDIAATGGKKAQPLYLLGRPTPPLPQEAGWKDTVVSYPGEVTRLVVRWAPASAPIAGGAFPFDPGSNGQGYVWHCHIIDHEDNEMMRPTKVTSNTKATRTYVRGTDY
jgi:FtsP/CotA-like multicopper oxidase with cupredoxin domain